MVHANIQPNQQQKLGRLINQHPNRFRDVQQNNRQRGVMKQSSGGQLEVAGAVVGIWGANYSMAATGNPYIGRNNNMLSSQHVRVLNNKNNKMVRLQTNLLLGDAYYWWSNFFISP